MVAIPLLSTLSASLLASQEARLTAASISSSDITGDEVASMFDEILSVDTDISLFPEEDRMDEEIQSNDDRDDNLIHNDNNNNNDDVIMDMEDDGESNILKLELLDSSQTFSCRKCVKQQQQNVAAKSNALMSVPDSSVYKDVVVIGNGPSGIALSYFLAGNWPYYNGCGESVNDMLHYRLATASAEAAAAAKDPHHISSIVEQDLRFLAQVSNKNLRRST